MSGVKKSEIISVASPHTVKKFELIESYIYAWAQTRVEDDFNNEIVFIDCMCNSGIYKDSIDGTIIKGTPLRIVEILRGVARSNPDKSIQIYFNDISDGKVNELRKHLPENERNFQIVSSVGDGNELLKTIGPQLQANKHIHFFLLYDPYDASIDWSALAPFLRNKGEVIINHMVSDPARAITVASKTITKEKYKSTYLSEFEQLVPYGSDIQAYEDRVEKIIDKLKGPRKYFVSAFPFYNRQNTQIYSLVHCTENFAEFKRYKQCAWQVFGAQSSTKHTSGEQYQLMLNFDPNVSGSITVETDKSCFNICDIAKYLNRMFSGQGYVPLSALWSALDKHPVFPSQLYEKQIISALEDIYRVTRCNRINPDTGREETFISFW